jgi:hypothetical protein
MDAANLFKPMLARGQLRCSCSQLPNLNTEQHGSATKSKQNYSTEKQNHRISQVYQKKNLELKAYDSFQTVYTTNIYTTNLPPSFIQGSCFSMRYALEIYDSVN